MFAHRFFGQRFYGNNYFGGVGADPVLGSGTHRFFLVF